MQNTVRGNLMMMRMFCVVESALFPVESCTFHSKQD